MSQEEGKNGQIKSGWGRKMERECVRSQRKNWRNRNGQGAGKRWKEKVPGERGGETDRERTWEENERNGVF